MNVLDLIEHNQFLTQLYPAGCQTVLVGQLDLMAFDRARLALHILDKPAIEVAKWERWGQAYNVVVVELLATGIQQLTVENWQNNQAELCQVEALQTPSGHKRFVLSGTLWRVVVEAEFVTFQSTSTYLLDE
jgi:hypothetical protein